MVRSPMIVANCSLDSLSVCAYACVCVQKVEISGRLSMSLARDDKADCERCVCFPAEAVWHEGYLYNYRVYLYVYPKS